MDKTSQQLLQNIQHIRKTTRRSIHDCASFLDISKNDYLEFERGDNFLSLPEIEALAALLGMPLNELFAEDLVINNTLLRLDHDLHPRYRQIRQKMILSKIILAQTSQDLSLDDLSQSSLIPVETLEGYINNTAPIPIDHLLNLLGALGLTIEQFLENNQPDQSDQEQPPEQITWKPEFPHESDRKTEEEDLYTLVKDALQTLPKADQAEILKAVLTLLRRD